MKLISAAVILVVISLSYCGAKPHPQQQNFLDAILDFEDDGEVNLGALGNSDERGSSSSSSSSSESDSDEDSGSGEKRTTTRRPTRPTTTRKTTTQRTQRPTTPRPTTPRPTTPRPTTQRPTTQRPTTPRPTTTTSKPPTTQDPLTTPRQTITTSKAVTPQQTTPNNPLTTPQTIICHPAPAQEQAREVPPHCRIICRPGDHYLVNPSNCNSFFQCTNMVPCYQPCPVDLVFDPSINVCVRKSEYSCEETCSAVEVLYRTKASG